MSGIAVSKHAIDRYMDRVKPGLDFPAAKRELESLVRASGPPSSEPPDWIGPEDQKHASDQWLELSDGIAVVVEKGKVAVSLFVRGGVKPKNRDRRNRRKANLRQARHTRNRKARRKGAGGRRPDPEPTWD